MSTHPNDVVVLVEQAAKGVPTDYLRVLLVSTAGAKDYAEYKDAAAVKAAFGETSEVGKMAAALFGQSPTLPSVAAVGIAEPSNAQGMTAALDTIRAANDDWYLLMTDQTDENMIEAIAAWADAIEPTEAQQLAGTQDARKLYVAQTSNKSATVSSKRSILLYERSVYRGGLGRPCRQLLSAGHYLEVQTACRLRSADVDENRAGCADDQQRQCPDNRGQTNLHQARRDGGR